jgi:hypothetical protein
MAIDTAIFLAGLETDGARQRATLLFMTGQASCPIVRHALGDANVLMRIMAGSAAELGVAAAALITPALLHLLGVSYRVLLLVGLAGLHEHRQEIGQRQTGSEVVLFAAARKHTHPREVTLFTYGIGQRRG